MPKMTLLELPVELLHSIFNYLDTQTILYSVRNTHPRLRAAIDTFNELRLSFSSINAFKSRSAMDFIQLENVVSLTLDCNNTTGASQVELFFSLFQLPQFTRLKSLALIQIDHPPLDQIFQDFDVRQLRSLNLDLNTSYERLRFTPERLRPFHSVLRNLSIDRCTYVEYHTILSCCLQLRVLEMGMCHVNRREQTVLPADARSDYPQLTSLTIHECSPATDQLYPLLSLTKSLVNLKLCTRRMRFGSIGDARSWETFIQTNLPFLKRFDFYFSSQLDQRGNEHLRALAITEFRTPFWLNDKRWLVSLEYNLTSSHVALHTAPLRTHNFEVIVLYETSSWNDSYRLLTRHWLNPIEYVSTEEVRQYIEDDNMNAIHRIVHCSPCFT